MNKKINIKSFVLGVCAALMITGIVSVGAQNIDVIINGIKIYWDGVEKTLTDTNGNKVEPMIYQGTTYVPLRAMSNLMGKEVDWNQSEMAVYVGTKPTMRTIPIAEMEENINGTDCNYRKSCSFNLKNETIECTNGAMYFGQYNNNELYYVLDNKFSRFTAKAVMPYSHVGETGNATLTFYSVENDGTENKIKSYDLKKCEDPINVDINLTGVTNLKVVVDRYEHLAIYDAYFLGE